MNRVKLLVDNFLVYGFANVLNKIIPFLMLPIITRMLTDPSDYAIYDLYSLIVSLGFPLVLLGVYDSMFREYFEKDDEKYKNNVAYTALRIVNISSLTVCIIFILLNGVFSKLFFKSSSYSIIIILCAIEISISTTSQMALAPMRIQNKRRIYVLSNILTSLLYYAIAIILVYLNYTYFGLIYANIISSFIVLIIVWLYSRRFYANGKFDKKIAIELLKVGLPLMPTMLIIWVFNSMDRIMISNIIGTSSLGIYAIGAKVASISTVIYTAFATGWQHFAFTIMKDKDFNKVIGEIWEVAFYFISVIFVSVFLFKDLIFNILFKGAYVQGVKVFPYLFLAPLLQILYLILGVQYYVKKKTIYSPIIYSIGAVINLMLNFLLIPKYGIEGAAVATLIGFVTVLLLNLYTTVIKLKVIIFSKRIYILILSFMILLIYMLVSGVNFVSILLGLGYIIISSLIYKNKVIKYFYNLREK